MNEPIEPDKNSRDAEQFSDERLGEFSQIEQQLRQCRPRGPRLDLSFVANAKQASESQSPALASIAPVMSRRTGYSTSQFFLATAASWIIGALVGGATIHYATAPSQSTAEANAQSTSQSTTAQSSDTSLASAQALNRSTAAESTSNSSVTDRVKTAIAPSNDWAGDSRYAMKDVVASELSDWQIDSPLSARGLTSRNVMARLKTERLITTPATIASIDQPFTPVSPSDRKQLMQQLLTEPENWFH